MSTDKPDSKPNCLKRCSNAIVNGLELFFYKLGLLIGKYPWLVILLGLIWVFLMIPGAVLFFYQENRSEELWVASTSEALADKEWVDVYFPSRVRFNAMILEDSNILTPTGLQAMLAVDTAVKNISGTGDWTYDWDSICARLGSECWSTSLLELWSFNATVISSLTTAEILQAVNNVTVSPVYGTEWTASAALGGLTYDSDGKITSAQAATMSYVIQYNVTVVDGAEVDLMADDWEQSFLDLGEAGNSDITEIHYYAFRTFSDLGGGAILGDLNFLIAGYFIVIIFVCCVLGRFNAVQQRIYVSLGGVVCVGFAIGASFGICSYAGVFYGPLHSILPFLLLGIGIDDMFVIVQAWDSVPDGCSNVEKTGQALKHAGVSITVTSLTDILAFGIGASTILPALQSFCIYCCAGIMATFLLQATFFVACLSINGRREDSEQAKRNACCCCYIHDDWTPNACSQKLIVQSFFENYYTRFLLNIHAKVGVIVVSVIFLAGGIAGTVMLEQEFDPAWFLPADSYASSYLEAQDTYFASDDVDSYIYLGQIDYYGNFSDILDLYDDVSNDYYVLDGSLDCWYYSFDAWMKAATNPAITSLLDANSFASSETNFYSLLNMYLYAFDMEGIRFASNLNFATNESLQASRFRFSHTNMDDTQSEIAGVDSIRVVTKASGFSELECFAYSFEYIDYETNKVIQDELYRNLGLAFLCVFVMTLILIADIGTCLLVGLCVIMTLVDVMGLSHFWGLTIDTVTSVNLIVGIGLAVDYSAHIGHTFMTARGTRNERMSYTLKYIAPAVFYGGFSTFLAFVLLAGSQSYVFRTFFKVFFAVVLFGMFHGLVFLPVLLSWIGPPPYDLAEGEEGDAELKDISAAKQGGELNGHVTASNGSFKNGHIEGISNQAVDTDTMHDLDSSPAPHPTSPNQVTPIKL